MPTYLILFFLEVVLLFFLSRFVHRLLGSKLFNVFKSKNLTIYTMSFLFFPGTLVHEMSHFLAALFLLVPVGEMSLLPKIDGKRIELGSVTIGRTDFVRRFLISTAPLLFGIITILTLSYFMTNNRQFLAWWQILIIGYLLFTVANTMFISRKDSEGVWGVIIFGVCVLIISVLAGFSIDLSFTKYVSDLDVLKTACLFLIFPIVLDIIAIVILKH